MKVMLVNGSPHYQGCTHTALEEVAKTLNEEGIETKIFWIGAKPIAGCLGCGHCRETGRCVFEDTVNLLAGEVGEYDGYVFGAPVHFASPGGAAVAFMDRLFMAAGSKMSDKPGASVVSCRRGGASSSFDVLNKYFTIRNMPVVSSQYWNQVHGNTPDEVRQDEEGLQTMRTLARNMAWLLRCIEAGKQAGVPMPKREEQIKTNFIR